MTSWRDDPDLRGRFHPQYPDDLQVVVHDGEPRRTQRGPEACWVRLTSVAGTLHMPHAPANAGAAGPVSPQQATWTQRTVYTGTLLNAPHNLTTVKQNDAIHVLHTPGLPHPLHVTLPYLHERPRWSIQPCGNCGADQTLDPMSTMAATRFPGAPAGSAPIAFSAVCPCGGTMMLQLVGA